MDPIFSQFISRARPHFCLKAEIGLVIEKLSFYYINYCKCKGVLFVVKNYGKHSVQMIV
jgi:hypothetical protein